MAAGLRSGAGTGIDYEHLAKILGMLGSAHDGEALAAARAAEKIRSSAGVVWLDILRPPALPDPPKRRASAPKSRPKASAASTERPKRRPWPRTFDLSKARHIELACDFVLEAGVANDWEMGFLASIRQWPPPLSEKQAETLMRLVEKGRRAAAAA